MFFTIKTFSPFFKIFSLKTNNFCLGFTSGQCVLRDLILDMTLLLHFFAESSFHSHDEVELELFSIPR